MVKYGTLLLGLIGISFFGNAQTVLFEEYFTDGIPATWTLYNEDGLVPADPVSEFTEAWIGKIVDGDTCAASTSYYEPSGQSNDYLVTPKLSIGNFSKLVWSARSVDASYPDGYYVLISSTDSLVASFTDTLYTVLAETASDFNARSVELDLEGYSNQDVYIAFKNATENGFILLLDEVVLLGAETASLADYYADRSNISVFPNPTTDFVTVRSESIIQEITVYTPLGQKVLTTNETTVDFTYLPAGTYFIAVQTVDGLETVSLIKK